LCSLSLSLSLSNKKKKKSLKKKEILIASDRQLNSREKENILVYRNNKL